MLGLQKMGLGLSQRAGVSVSVTVTINGLTGGYAVSGDHASITMSVSEGTISARKWGSTSGGSEYGTGTSPTDYDGGTTLYATATVDSVDYTGSATIAEISLGTPVYTRGTAGVAPGLNVPDLLASGISGGTYEAHIAVYTAASTDTAAQIAAGSGDAAEYFTVGPNASLGGLDLSTLDIGTTMTGAANHLFRVVYEHSSGVLSPIGTSNLATYDPTAPVFSSAEVGNVADTTVRVTFDKAIYDPSSTLAAGDFAVTGFTVSSVAHTDGNSYVDLTLSTAVTDSDVLTGDLSYTGTDLVGIDAETVATFSGEDVTNNVTSGISFVSEVSGSIPLDAAQVKTSLSLPTGLQENDVVVYALFGDDPIPEGTGALTNRVVVDETQNYDLIQDDQASPGLFIAVARMGATPDTVLEYWPAPTRTAQYMIQAWRGVNTTTMQDATATQATGSTGNPTPAAITTANDGALVITVGGKEDVGADWTAPSGYTNFVTRNGGGSNSASCGMASQIIATAGAETPGAWGSTGADDGWENWTIALRPA